MRKPVALASAAPVLLDRAAILAADSKLYEAKHGGRNQVKA